MDRDANAAQKPVHEGAVEVRPFASFSVRRDRKPLANCCGILSD